MDTAHRRLNRPTSWMTPDRWFWLLMAAALAYVIVPWQDHRSVLEAPPPAAKSNGLDAPTSALPID